MASLSFSIRKTTLDLAMAGLERLAYIYIRRNPLCRMHEISKGVFSAVDHKQMLASVVVKRLVDANLVTKHYPLKLDRNGNLTYDEHGKVVRYKHFVYAINFDKTIRTR